MKKSKSILLFIILSFFLCTQCSKKMQLGNSFVLNDPIASIVDSFTLLNKDKNIYELYINKIHPDTTILLLFAGEKSLIEKENIYYNQKSIIKILSNGIQINVYSGIERYIRKYSSQINKHVDILPAKGMSDGIWWVIIDIRGRLTTEKDYYGVYPFMPLPLLNKKGMFVPPVIKPNE